MSSLSACRHIYSRIGYSQIFRSPVPPSFRYSSSNKGDQGKKGGSGPAPPKAPQNNPSNTQSQSKQAIPPKPKAQPIAPNSQPPTQPKAQPPAQPNVQPIAQPVGNTQKSAKAATSTASQEKKPTDPNLIVMSEAGQKIDLSKSPPEVQQIYQEMYQKGIPINLKEVIMYSWKKNLAIIVAKQTEERERMRLGLEPEKLAEQKKNIITKLIGKGVYPKEPMAPEVREKIIKEVFPLLKDPKPFYPPRGPNPPWFI